jgi:hypothetical protein
MSVYKATISGLRVVAATAVLLPLMFGGCEGFPEEPANSGSADNGSANPGPNTSFWTSLTVDSSIIAREYLPVRVIIQTDDDDDEKTGQLGLPAVSPIAGTQRYKITLPESYLDHDLRFVVEFEKNKSVFDEIAEIKRSPIVLNLLKSRYCVIKVMKEHIPKRAINDVELNVEADAELKLGFGPNGIKLSDVPDAPLIFLLNIVQEEIEAYKFTFLGAIAVPPGNLPGFTEIIEIMDDLNSGDLNSGIEGIYGFSLPEMDWFMVMLPEPVYKEGDPFDILLFAEQASDTGVCPCGNCESGCDYGISLAGLPSKICPYEFAAIYGYPHTITRPVTKEDIEKITDDDGTVETGSTIQIYVHETDIKTCEDFKADMEAKIPKLLEQ